MKKKHFLFLIIIFLLLIGTYFVTSRINTSTKNSDHLAFKASFDANSIVELFTTNEKNATNLYAGEIIEVIGYVDTISFLNAKNTIILSSTTKNSGVICEIQPNQKNILTNLKQKQKISAKGICKGFLKDVILLNCYITIYE